MRHADTIFFFGKRCDAIAIPATNLSSNDVTGFCFFLYSENCKLLSL